ncbi:hypothetical protein ABNC96_20015, partial [Paenibacillus larvae]
RAMNMAPFIFWNLAFYTIIRTQLTEKGGSINQDQQTAKCFLKEALAVLYVCKPDVRKDRRLCLFNTDTSLLIYQYFR